MPQRAAQHLASSRYGAFDNIILLELKSCRPLNVLPTSCIKQGSDYVCFLKGNPNGLYCISGHFWVWRSIWQPVGPLPLKTEKESLQKRFLHWSSQIQRPALQGMWAAVELPNASQSWKGKWPPVPTKAALGLPVSRGVSACTHWITFFSFSDSFKHDCSICAANRSPISCQARGVRCATLKTTIAIPILAASGTWAYLEPTGRLVRWLLGHY